MHEHIVGVAVYAIDHDWRIGVLAHIVTHLNEMLGSIREVVFVDLAIVTHQIARHRAPDRVFQHCLGQLVNIFLRFLTEVHIAISSRTSGHTEQRVKHKGIFAVNIQPGILPFWVILSCIQHYAVAELHIVHHILAVHIHLVVPVYHLTAIAFVHRIIKLVLCLYHTVHRG